MDFLTRAGWGATARLGPAMTLPALGVFVHHSVTVYDDDGDHYATGDVAADMRDIERIGVQRFGRFSYSYGIHPTLWVAEGAGVTVGAHTANYNSRHFGVVFIGNKDNEPLSDGEIALFGELCQTLVAQGRLVPNFFVKPHREVKSTACPGGNVMARWQELVASAYGSVPAPPAPPPPPPAPTPAPVPPSSGRVPVTVNMPQLSQGSRGLHVAAMQSIITIKSEGHQPLVADGVFGPKTDAEVREWQRWAGLADDGIVGPNTWASLLQYP